MYSPVTQLSVHKAALATNVFKQSTTTCALVLAATVNYVPSAHPPTHFPYIFPASRAAKRSPELYLLLKVSDYNCVCTYNLPHACYKSATYVAASRTCEYAR
jgi:hypothetical protein